SRAHAGGPAPARYLPPSRGGRGGVAARRRDGGLRDRRTEVRIRRHSRRTRRGRPMTDEATTALAKVVDGGSLTLDEARAAMGSVMDGEATPALLAALLVALRMRGETGDEPAGFANATRERL